MPWVAAGVAAVATVAGSAIQADATASAADQANETQRAAQKQTQDNFQPYLDVGQNALMMNADLAGANGRDAQTAGFADFQASPGYQYQVDEGIRAVNSGAAATGLLGSGAQLKALQDRGQGIANQEFNTYYNRLLGLTQIGQNSAANTGVSGVQTAAGIAQTQASLGSAQASAYGNAAQGIGNAASAYGNNRLYQQQTSGAQQPIYSNGEQLMTPNSGWSS